MFYRQHSEFTAHAPHLDQKQSIPGHVNIQIWFVINININIVRVDAKKLRNVQVDLQIGHRFKTKESSLAVAQAEAEWREGDIMDKLTLADLAPESLRTMLAIEQLQEPNGSFMDRLVGDLGQVRVL